MKIRNGFVSNSSSSSFIVKRSVLTEKQVQQIYNYYVSALFLNMEGIPKITDEQMKLAKEKGIWEIYGIDKELANDLWCYINWTITTIEKDDETYLEGFSVIDNFNMYKFFELIGIDNNEVDWENS